MQKSFLIALVFLFCASGVAQGQITPMPDSGGHVDPCLQLKKELDAAKLQVAIQEFKVLEAEAERDERARILQGYRDDLAYGEANGLGTSYLDSCRRLIAIGVTKLSEAEAAIRTAERWLVYYKILLFLAELKYSGNGC